MTTFIKGHCDECERAGREPLREIAPTDQPVGRTGSARRWVLEHHSNGAGELCPGSGAQI